MNLERSSAARVVLVERVCNVLVELHGLIANDVVFIQILQGRL